VTAANEATGPELVGRLPDVDLQFVDFRTAGDEAPGEFRCADCGYGVIVQRVLPPCPMCGGGVWEPSWSRSRPPAAPLQ
jgi:hypothetical protein